MKRCALYVRVSTQEQKINGLSVDNQIDALKTFCNEKGWIVYDVYNDAGISARKAYKRRPELLRMIADCQAGKVDVCLFTKLDRFFRSVPDYYEAVGQMNGVPWRAIWEDYETETPSGIFRVNIMLSVAQNEADSASARVKAVLDYKRQKGEYVGAGIVNTGYLRKDKGIIIDESKREAVSAMFKEYLTTFSVSSAHKKAFECGLDIPIKRVHYMLQNEIYAGKIQNVTVEPYITREEHELIMKTFEERRTRFSGTGVHGSPHIFSGLIKCSECGHNMLVKKNCPRGKKTYIYYKCDYSKSHRFTIPEERLEKYMLDNLQPLFDSYKIKSVQLSDIEIKEHNADIKKLEAKLKRVGIRFEEGDIEESEYRFKREQIQKEIESLTSEMSPKRKELELPSSWREMYLSLDDVRKRAFWCNAIDYIEVYPDAEKPPKIYF